MKRPHFNVFARLLVPFLPRLYSLLLPNPDSVEDAHCQPVVLVRTLKRSDCYHGCIPTTETGMSRAVSPGHRHQFARSRPQCDNAPDSAFGRHCPAASPVTTLTTKGHRTTVISLHTRQLRHHLLRWLSRSCSCQTQLRCPDNRSPGTPSFCVEFSSPYPDSLSIQRRRQTQ